MMRVGTLGGHVSKGEAATSGVGIVQDVTGIALAICKTTHFIMS